MYATDENLIVIEEEGLAVSLGDSHNKGACVPTNGAHPGKDGGSKSFPREAFLGLLRSSCKLTCGPDPVEVTLHSEIFGSLSLLPLIPSSLHHQRV